MKPNMPAERLFAAARKGDIGGIRAALAEGISPDATHGNGRVTPLMIAAKRGHALAVQYLIDAGANINHANNHRRTALHLAIANRKADAAKLLIERGAQVDIEDNRGNSPVSEAMDSLRGEEATEIIQMLLGRGAPIYSGRGNWSGLRAAVLQCNAPLAQLFLEHGASPDDETRYGGAYAEAPPREILKIFLQVRNAHHLSNQQHRSLRSIDFLFREWDKKQQPQAEPSE